MAMAVAIDTARLGLDFIPQMQRELDRVVGDGRRFKILMVSAYATILPYDSEIWRQLYSMRSLLQHCNSSMAEPEAMDWQAEPEDDLGDVAELHHLQQQAATDLLLSSVNSQMDHGNGATTLTGTASSASTNAGTQARFHSSFHRHSYRLSSLILGDPLIGVERVGLTTDMTALFPHGVQDPTVLDLLYSTSDPYQVVVWTGPQRNNQLVFSQVQVNVRDRICRGLGRVREIEARQSIIDDAFVLRLTRFYDRLTCFCDRLTFYPRKRRRTLCNQNLPVSHSPVVDFTSRGIPIPLSKRFNGVRHRTGRKIWVAEWKPPKHKTKQDFGSFKSEGQAARAVDAAYHHYGRPDLLNFPDTSLHFLSTRPTAPVGLDQKAKVKFVRDEAKLLLAATLHPTHTSSLPIPELSASPRHCPSGPFRSFSEISSPPISCSGPDERGSGVLHPQAWMLQDSICDNSTTGVVTNWGTLNLVQSAEQGWDRAEDSCTQAAPPNVVNPSPSEGQAFMWLDSYIRSPPAPTYPRSPSPSHSHEALALALQEHQHLSMVCRYVD